MKRLLQINVTANWGSTGRIAEKIGQLALDAGWESYVAYGRHYTPSKSRLIKIGGRCDFAYHLLQSRLFDRHGLASKSATLKLIATIRQIKPSVIHLHNIHGYYLNYQLLFDYLRGCGVPVVWTLHDCWAFTGHCAFFDMPKCNKWTECCHDCPALCKYPQSLFIDRSRQNFKLKKECFTSLSNLTLVPVSDWLNALVGKSFLCKHSKTVIKNGINVNVFKPAEKQLEDELVHIIGVASRWTQRKGFSDFFKLRNLLGDKYEITLVGLSKQQIRDLPDGINGKERTNSIDELAKLYSRADMFVNPTYEDNYPTTNLEAIACGTPVITYNTGGSPEVVDAHIGLVVPVGDVQALAGAIKTLGHKSGLTVERCRAKAVSNFDEVTSFSTYFNLYKKLISHG